MKTKIVHTLTGLLKSLIFPVFMYLLFMIITLAAGHKGFVSGNAFEYIFSQSVMQTIIALAIAIPLSGGRWDFATGTIAVLGGIIGCNLAIMLNAGVFGMIVITVAVCIGLAVIEGALYLLLRVPTMIVSLGVVMIYEALSGILFDGGGVQLYVHENLAVVGSSPWCYLILAAVLIIVYFLLYHTTFGYDTRSLGSNAKLALNNGVKEKKNIMLTYVLVGGLLGAAAILNACKGNVAPASNLSSTSLMFSSMGPVLVGLFLSRYANLPWGVFMGAIGMTCMSYGMVVLGIDGSIQTIVLGIIIVLIMAYTTNQARLQRQIKGLINTIKIRKQAN